MRIANIHIEGFGHFTDCSFGPFESPISILYGPNEAGKSTLLSFLKCVLFGFPRRGGTQHYPPMAGGRHGGRIDVLDQFGDHYSVHRIQGRSGGPVTVSRESGETQSESTLARLLGHHAEDVFECVFSFTLDELHSDRLLNDKNVNSQIYSAGMGVVKLPDSLKQIKNRRDQRFLKGGNRHSISQTVDKIREIDKMLTEIASNAESYGRLTNRLKDIDEERKQKEIISKQLKSHLEYHRRLASGWDDWVDFNSAKESLKGIEVMPDFPIDGIRRLEKLEERIRGEGRALEAARELVEVEESRAKTIIEHESIIEHADSVQFLERNREHFESAVRDLPLRESEFGDRERLLEAALREIGPDWNATRLQEFDLSVAVRNEISQFEDRFSKREEEVSRLESELSQEEDQLQRAVEAESTAQQNLEVARKPSIRKEKISEHRATIRRVEAGLLELKAVRDRSTLHQDQLDGLAGHSPSSERGTRQKAFAGLVVIVGLGLLIGGPLWAGDALIIGMIGGLALISVGVYLLVDKSASRSKGDSPQASSLRNALARAEAEREELDSRLAQDQGKLGLETVDSASLTAIAAALDKEESLIQEFTSLCKSLDLARDSTKEHRTSVDRLIESSAAAKAQFEECKKEWQVWLRAHGLSEGFSPQVVAEIRGKVERGLDYLRELQDLHQRIDSMKDNTSNYLEVVTPLASGYGINLDSDRPTSAIAAADRLNALQSEIEIKVRRRKDAEEALVEARLQLEERQRDLEKAETELKELLRAGGANDSEAFRRREEADSKRKALKSRKQDSLSRLQRIAGTGKPLEVFMSALGKTNAQSISDQVRQFEEELDTIDAHLGRLNTELGSINSELNSLSNEEESSKLRMQRNLLLEQIQEHAREWAKLMLAERLLDEARSTFERERQPGVVRNAEVFFKNITGGRYDRVIAPLGENLIQVSEANGLTKEPNALSRGTREQLFLSLRFGLVQELGQRTEPLPVIVDEVLVNFDPERALRAAKAFVQLSSTNQVLVFTCHPIVVEHFQAAAKEMNSPDPTLIPIEQAVS